MGSGEDYPGQTIRTPGDHDGDDVTVLANRAVSWWKPPTSWPEAHGP